jgi:hypothetical protein
MTVEPRSAFFICKHCSTANEQPFPEVRVITQKERCQCGLSSDTRISRAWATALGVAVSIAILAGFGSCVADHYYTTEQIKALPAGYQVERKPYKGGLGPDLIVTELTPQEKERRAMIERIRALEKELEGKGK